jgi:hypothetical protein
MKFRRLDMVMVLTFQSTDKNALLVKTTRATGAREAASSRVAPVGAN